MIKKRKHNDKWIIGIKPYSNISKDNYLDLVLAYLPFNTITKYVTWIYNHSDNGFHEGNYHQYINKAIPEFFERGNIKYNEKFIYEYDAIECHYVHLIENNIWGPCDAEDAQMVSVYLHVPDGGIESITDHLNGLDAMRIVRYISNKYELPIKYQPEGVHYIKLKPIN